MQHIRDVTDPEHPYTLEQLNVVSEDLIEADDLKSTVRYHVCSKKSTESSNNVTRFNFYSSKLDSIMPKLIICHKGQQCQTLLSHG